MSKYKDTMVICHDQDKCGHTPCAHGISHLPIIVLRNGKNRNYCKMKCTIKDHSDYGCCKPVKMNTKWDL